MPRRAAMSLYGLYQYDPTLLDGLSLPTQIDADVLKTNLLMETAELEVIYPDAEFMKLAVTSWSDMMVHAWQKQADVLFEDYDPFINLKRDETRVITEERDLAGNETRNLAGTAANTQQNNVNAWDDQSEDGVRRNTVIDNGNTSDTGTIGTTDTGTVTTTEEYHMTGDSAITDAQDVAIKEIRLRAEHNMYIIIINDFKQRFCLLVY